MGWWRALVREGEDVPFEEVTCMRAEVPATLATALPLVGEVGCDGDGGGVAVGRRLWDVAGSGLKRSIAGDGVDRRAAVAHIDRLIAERCLEPPQDKTQSTSLDSAPTHRRRRPQNHQTSQIAYRGCTLSDLQAVFTETLVWDGRSTVNNRYLYCAHLLQHS